MEFKCPYCFRPMHDNEVHFRSAQVSEGKEFPWPDDIVSERYFETRYDGPDKDKIRRDYEEWKFFKETPDEKYEKFWSDFAGFKTEDDLMDGPLRENVKPYERRVIDPADPTCWEYLRPHDPARQESAEDFLCRDPDGMVSEIVLRSGKKCVQRVCPHCHNPLPHDYGKYYRTKFITVIGGTGSGKTVFLSQLMDKMGQYAAKNGLAANVTHAGTMSFRRRYRVAVNEPLPMGTLPNHLQQPLIYELSRMAGPDSQFVDMVVLYDVAGEVFNNREWVPKFAPFVSHADGVIILLEPKQFDLPEKGKNIVEPHELLNSIFQIVSSENLPQTRTSLQSDTSTNHSGEKQTRSQCATPIAVCLSKSDLPCVHDAMDGELYRLLQEDVSGIPDGYGFYRAEFNAKAYNPILDGLKNFFHEHDFVLDNDLHTHYSKYAYFAFTALGCAVEERTGPKGIDSFPIGPKLEPRRIEEPLLWLLYELGYTTANESIHYPWKKLCPYCQLYMGEPYQPEKPETQAQPEEKLGWFQRFLAFLRRLFHRMEPEPDVTPNRKCTNCNGTWYESPQGTVVKSGRKI